MEKKVEVPKPYIPDQCKDVPSLAQELKRLVDAYEAELGKENGILGDAHTAIAGKDLKKLNDVLQRQIDVKNASIGTLVNIRETNNKLDSAIEQCSTAMAR